MRKIIAALQVSLDGFIEGPNGELERHALTLLVARPLQAGAITLRYSVPRN